MVAEIVVMKTIHSGFVGLVAGAVALTMLVAPAWSAKPAPAAQPQIAASNKPIEPSENKNFGDWTVRCYPVSSPTPCEMLQLLVNKKTGQRVLGVVILYAPSRDQSIMQIALPLGVMLQSGAVLSSDTFKSSVLHYGRCDAQGCYVVLPVDNDTMGALGRATKAEMQIVSVDGKKYNLAFSLNGFTAGHSALMDLARQKATAAPAAPAPAPSEGN